MKVIFLLKAEGQFKHSGKYYLLNGHWHLIGPKNQAPKGAPVSAHPHAAGQHAPAKHFTDDEWDKLKLPAENVNAGTYNKQLEQLKQHSEAGHVSGILGTGFGTNTYGKKLSIIANHLLEKHGSPHKVTPGQKAGEHPAVQSAPAEPAPEAKPDPTPEPPKVEAEPPKVESAAPKVESSSEGLTIPQFEEGKEAKGVVAYYEKKAKHVVELANAGAITALNQMLANGMLPNAKGKVSNTFAGKTKNSKLFLQLMLDAQKKAKAVARANQAQESQPEPAKPEPPKPAAQAPAAAPAGFDFDSHKLPDSNANAKSHNGKIEHLKKLHAAGDVAGLESFKAGVNTYGKKQMKLAAAAAEHLKQSKGAALVENDFDTNKLAEAFKNAKAKQEPQNHDFTQWLKDGAPTNAAIQDAWHDLPNDQKEKHQEEAYGAETMMDSAIQNAGSASEAKSIAEAYLKKHGNYPGNIGYVKAALKSAGYNNLITDMFDGSGVDAKVKAPEKPSKPKIREDEISKIADHLETKFQNYLAGGQKFSVQHSLNIIDKNKDAIEKMGSEHSKLFEYADNVQSYIDANGPQDGATSGPQDGDTKPAADGGTLVFKDGHWHKQQEPTPDAQPKAAEAQHPIDAVPDPDLSTFSPLNKAKIEEGIKNLKQAIKDNGPAALNGVAKKIKGYTHITLVKDNGYKFKVKGHELVPDSSATKLYDYVMQLKAAAGKPKKASKPKAAAAPKASQPAAGIQSMDHWQQTGPQGGSNPGGKFKDENGVEWYCKFPADEDTAKAEVLAAKLYSLAGVTGQDAKLITKNGKLGIASKWTDVTKASPEKLAKTDGVLSGFAVDAWLGNWDVVGLGYDNLQVGADGKAVRVDAGGSLMYRAQGGKKAFGDTVPELDSLKDPAINPQAAKVFGGMSEADLLASVAKVVNLSDTSIMAAVMTSGYGSYEDRQKLAATLIARKKFLADKYPKAVKKKEVKFKPEDISAPPDFLNWGSTGKSGPSSKEFLNQANHQAAQDIHAAAKTGSIDAVKNLKAPIYNKDTGDITGSAGVLDHPSQHIKGYAQQVINEINFQLNPPKKFRFEGGHPLHALNAAYPPYTGPLQGDKAAKVGKYVSLGDPGTFTPDALGLPKITHKSGQLTQQTYAKQAQAAISKMPSTQRQAVQAYTGSGYHSINSSLWNGNPSGQAKAAGEALHTLAHDIEPGTLLSRKLSLSGQDLHALLGSTGKVLQEPAIMSTSIRPTSWSGNVQLKLTVGPGVKGLWVGYGSMPGGGALSNHPGEDEMVLPPNTRIMIVSVKKSTGADADGFGQHVEHVIEAIILPSEGY